MPLVVVGSLILGGFAVLLYVKVRGPKAHVSAVHPVSVAAVVPLATAVAAEPQAAPADDLPGKTEVTSPQPSEGPASAGAIPNYPNLQVEGEPPVLTRTVAYEVKQKKEALLLIARRFLPQTAYVVTPDLEEAIRQANGTKKDFFSKGEQVKIPGVLAAPIRERSIPAAKETPFHGLYFTGSMADSVPGVELIRQWRKLGGNAIVFDLKDFDGIVNVPYDSPLAPLHKRYAISDPPKFVHFLHSLGLHVIARSALFRDAYQAENHPQLAVKSRRTGKPWRENGKLAWLDPSLPEVQNYNLGLAKVAVRGGADEIQFDYVRFPAEGDQADARFSFETTHPKWKRTDVISDFLARAQKELHAEGVLMSLDVFGVMAWQRDVDLKHTGQLIPSMARNCDVLSPMIYPSHFFGMDGYLKPGLYPEHFIGEAMKRFITSTEGSGVVLRPWLQAFAWRTPSYSPAYVMTQVKVAGQGGGVGFLFWNARNDYSKVFPAASTILKVPAKAQAGPVVAGIGQSAPPPSR